MKRLRYFLPGLLILITSVSYAQSQPFVFTLFGGLFFPSHVDFKETYRTNSDIIWGVGFSLPVKSTLYIGSDVSYFRAKSLAESLTDSTMKLEERFIHIGVLNKQPLTGSFLIRLSAGLSYTTIKQISSSSRSVETIIEGDKKIGYYGGIGIEQPLEEEGHLSAFADVIYDYRRSERKELYGDFGGIRVVLGIHLFLF